MSNRCQERSRSPGGIQTPLKHLSKGRSPDKTGTDRRREADTDGPTRPTLHRDAHENKRSRRGPYVLSLAVEHGAVAGQPPSGAPLIVGPSVVEVDGPAVVRRGQG